MLALGPDRDWKVPVMRTEATKGEGIDELLRTIDAHGEHIAAAGTLAERRARNLRAEVLGIAAARMRRELEGARQLRPRAGRSCWSGSSGARSTQRRPRASCWNTSAMTEHCGLRRPAGRRGLARLDRPPPRRARRRARSAGSRAASSTSPAASPSGCSPGWGASATTRSSRPATRSRASATCGFRTRAS